MLSMIKYVHLILNIGISVHTTYICGPRLGAFSNEGLLGNWAELALWRLGPRWALSLPSKHAMPYHTIPHHCGYHSNKHAGGVSLFIRSSLHPIISDTLVTGLTLTGCCTITTGGSYQEEHPGTLYYGFLSRNYHQLPYLGRRQYICIPATDRYLNDCATVFLFPCSGKTRTHTSVLSTTRPGALCRIGKDMRQKYKEIYNIFIYILLYIFYIILYYVDT